MAAPASNKPVRQEAQPASSEITELAPGILRSQLPIMLPGLQHVNMYLLEDERGVAVVDPGMPGPQSWRALVDRLKRAGYKPSDVHTVVVTHSHPDHFGGAGRLRDKYGAEVIAHTTFRTWFDPAEDEQSDEDIEDGTATPPPAGPVWGRQLPWRTDAVTTGPPRSRRVRMKAMRVLARGFVKTPAPTKRVADADIVTLAKREWVAVHTPGHTSDHLCLFSPTDGVVLSGDHVLPTITPHISGLVGDDPLTEFFQSLEKVAGLDGTGLVLPAHGHPFDDLGHRCGAIREHHEERLTMLRDAAAELGDASVEDYSHRLFKPRSWGQMAESETYAHLEHLRLVGEMDSHHDAKGLLRYHLVG